MVNQIRQLQDISSIETDLRYAQNDLDLCKNLGQAEELKSETPQNSHDARIIGALFSQSLIYYTRATKSESKHRGFAPITKGWPTDLQQLHIDITKIRDDIVAHFGPGTNHVSGFWSREAIVLCLGDTGKFWISTPFVRANYRKWAVVNLFRLIDRAYKDCLVIKNQRLNVIAKQIELHQADDIFIAALRCCTFLPESFFVSKSSAKAFHEHLGSEFPVANSLHPVGTH